MNIFEKSWQHTTAAPMVALLLLPFKNGKLTEMEKIMKPLPTTFQSGGFEFRQLARHGRVVLLAKSKPPFTSPFTWQSYEVVIVGIRQVRMFLGKSIPAHEVIPPSEAWGMSGWSFSDLTTAHAKFDALAQQQRNVPRQNAPDCPNCLAQERLLPGEGEIVARALSGASV